MRKLMVLFAIVITAAWNFHLIAAAPAPKDTALTAGKLIEAFLTNEAFAEENYIYKEIEVTGTMHRVMRNKYDGGRGDASQHYLLEMDAGKAGRTDRANLDLLFAFAAEDRARLAKLKPGDKVVIRGKCGPPILWAGEAKKLEKDYYQVWVTECKLVDGK